MSNLKRDIEGAFYDYFCSQTGGRPPSRVKTEEATTQIINLIEAVIPEEKTWNTNVAGYSNNDDYKEGRAYNQAIKDIKSKLIGGSNGKE